MATALILWAAAGCARPHHVSERTNKLPDGMILTRQQIIASGAHDALEALEKAGTHLLIQRTREGGPERITYRGIESLFSDPQVLVVVDGAIVSAPTEHLRSIPVESIAYIQILPGRAATPRFGVNAGNGAILVSTTAR